MNHLSEERLNEYLDGVLDEVARAETVVHLQGCPACQQKLTELQQLFAALEEVATADLAIDLETAVLAQLSTAPDPIPFWLRWLPVLQAMVALAMGWWLLPSVRGWLVQGQAWLTTTAADWQMPSFDWLLRWQTAVGDPLRQLPAVPTLSLPAMQWALLLGLAFSLWLITNTLFLREDRQ